jgi:FkbM family methyltransferase
MKKILRQLASSMGYTISRTDQRRQRDPFEDMTLYADRESELVIFDVGAHHGQTARVFRRWFPNSWIYSFEPFPESFANLRANTKADHKISQLPFGLGGKDDVKLFHSNAKSVTNSLLPTDPRGSQVWGVNLLETMNTCEVPVRSLDSVLQELELKRIDILKLDVQGAEHQVIAGARRACKERRIGMIYSEIITQPTYVGQLRFDKALEVFYESGFDLHHIYNLATSKERRLCQVDALFVAAQ